MKYVPLPQLLCQAFALLGVTLMSSMALPVGASSLPSSIGRDLIYPRSSERFFQAGNAQLELEIQRLQNRSEVSMSLLKIDLDLFQQQQQLREQQEIRSPEILQNRDYSVLDRGHSRRLPLWKHN